MTDKTHATYQGQRSVGSKVRVRTDGQTDGTTDRFTVPANTVGKHTCNQNVQNRGVRYID